MIILSNDYLFYVLLSFQLHDRVLDGVQTFRVETDSAWTKMMEIQVKVLPESKPYSNPFQTFVRQKRELGLPSFCICQPKRECPPGPTGPQGDPGPDGRKLIHLIELLITKIKS